MPSGIGVITGSFGVALSPLFQRGEVAAVPGAWPLSGFATMAIGVGRSFPDVPFG
jgi:hypothetical protein